MTSIDPLIVNLTAFRAMPEKLAGTIERITFHNLDNGYVVLHVQVKGRREWATVVGHCSSVVAGEYIEAVGEWQQNRDFGLQFKAEHIHTNPPHTIEGIIKYLGSGLIKGIGPHYAKKIVELFGERTLQVIDESPTFLAEVKGIGPQRLQRIRQSWQQQKGVRNIMVFLQSYGMGTARAVRIYKTYGDQAIEMVKSNPYRLTTDIWGIGFRTADELAMRLGLPKDSPLRARAAVRFVLQEYSTAGHVGYPEEGVIARTIELTQIPESVIRQAIDEARHDGELVRDQLSQVDAPATELQQPWLFLKPLFLAERGVARRIAQLRQGTHPLAQRIRESALTWVESKMGIQLADTQREAIRAATREKVLIITGGPGVGKTTIVRGILELFESQGLRVALATPTGRAAKRLSESTGREARTIHRWLEFDPSHGGFKRDRDNPLEFELIVVDEVSMVDVVLMNSLLRAVSPWACLVLVGDVDQLPSVGPGAVLGDLIRSQAVPTVRLTEIFRQAGQSWIVRAAHAVNQGREPQSAPPGGQGDFYFIEVDEPATVVERIQTMVRERIPQRFGLDPFRDIQVLSPMNKHEVGVNHLNVQLQALLNPPRPNVREVQRFGTTFRVGDKVLQTQNNYQKDVFNGDIGRIVDIDPQEQEVFVEFDGRVVNYEYGELDELVLAYACSIHKSQGSEYPAVVIPLTTQHYIMLQRNLLYTGITRGKKLVAVVGSRKALRIAVQKQDTAMRFSMLPWRLRQQLAKYATDATASEEFHLDTEDTSDG